VAVLFRIARLSARGGAAGHENPRQAIAARRAIGAATGIVLPEPRHFAAVLRRRHRGGLPDTCPADGSVDVPTAEPGA
jgi:hypothetical protein